MNKTLKYTLIGLAIVAVLAAAFYAYKHFTKDSAETEPEQTEEKTGE